MEVDSSTFTIKGNMNENTYLMENSFMLHRISLSYVIISETHII